MKLKYFNKNIFKLKIETINTFFSNIATLMFQSVKQFR